MKRVLERVHELSVQTNESDTSTGAKGMCTFIEHLMLCNERLRARSEIT